MPLLWQLDRISRSCLAGRARSGDRPELASRLKENQNRVWRLQMVSRPKYGSIHENL